MGTYEYIGDKVVAATLQVLVQPEGGEWQMVQDLADDYMDYNFRQLMDANVDGFQKMTIGLADYAGQKVKVAFRYVGSDGDAMFLDAVGIGFPTLDNVSYSAPLSTFYWGLDKDFNALQIDVAQLPVCAPVTWTNTSTDVATFSWIYNDPATGESTVSDNQEYLEVTYQPDYTNAATIRNNLIAPPVLAATSPGSAPAEYSAPFAYIQAGGKSDYEFSDGTLEFSLFPYGINEYGIGMITVDDEEIGDMSIPVFGHSVNTNQYWLNYSLNGETAMPSDYSRLEGIANLYIPDIDAPVVVNGVNVFGFGLINADAELSFTIYALNEYRLLDPATYTVVATANIKGSDIIRMDENSKSYLVLPFKFDSPVVVQASEEHPAFFFMLEGFNSDEVQYFAPLQAKEQLNGMSNAYMMVHVDLSAQMGRPAYYNVKPIIYLEEGEYIDPSSAFAFGLDAEFPWLTSSVQDIEIGASESEAQVALGSYYDGSKLTVEVPAGLVASVTGRYNECVLTVSRAEGSTDAIDGKVTVKGPGVEVSMGVSVKEDISTGVASVAGENSAVSEVYDLYGRRINAAASNGLYLIKKADGTVSKKVVK